MRAVDRDAATVPIGRPIANTEVYLLDAHGEPVPPGVPGEIYIGGPGLAAGYLGRPRSHRRALRRRIRSIPTPGARLYRTGDRARYRGDGTIEFIGRRRPAGEDPRTPDRAGESRSGAARGCPSVREAVVVMHGDTSETRRLTAYVVPAKGAQPVRRPTCGVTCAASLPDYMIPAGIVLLAALPLTPNGKIDRRALPDPVDLALQRKGFHVPPRDPLEFAIASIWRDLLGLASVGVRDNFFDIGGHSLLAVRMMAAVERATRHASVPLALAVQRADDRASRRRPCATSPRPSESMAVPVTKTGARPPLFFLHGDFSGGGFYSQGLARALGPDQPFYAVHPHGIDGPRIPDSIEAMARGAPRAHCARPARTAPISSPAIATARWSRSRWRGSCSPRTKRFRWS